MRSRNRFCCGKAISFTYSEYVSVTLVIQQAMCMRRIILSPAVCPAAPDFSTLHYLTNSAIFGKPPLLNIKVCLVFSTVFLKHFSFQEETSEIWSKIYIGLHVKCPLLLSDFNKTRIFTIEFSTTTKIWISWKSAPSGGTTLSCVTSQKSVDVTLAFRDFADAP